MQIYVKDPLSEVKNISRKRESESKSNEFQSSVQVNSGRAISGIPDTAPPAAKKRQPADFSEVSTIDHNSAEFPCRYSCGSMYTTPWYRDPHERKCKNLRRYCELCEMGFRNWNDFQEHKKDNSCVKRIGCPTCNVSCADIQSYHNHCTYVVHLLNIKRTNQTQLN